MSIFKTPAGEQAVMAFYDNTLARWPVPYESRTIPTRHGDTHLIVSGEESAPPLILLHGASANALIWIGDVVDYSQHYRVYALDIPGEPGRSEPHYLDWHDATFVEWLADVLDRLAIPRAILVGISQGGWIALKFACHAPERVTHLVLLAPGGVILNRASWLPRAFVLLLLGRRGMYRLTRQLFGAQPVPEGTEDAIALIGKHYKPRMSTIPVFADGDLQRLTMPTLLIGGDRDICFDVRKIAARLRRFVPDLEVNIIPGAGHALINTTGPILAFLGAAGTASKAAT
jgi:pimeloyl-ACP methyl ester carboxylesterase